ncbi:HlyD family efflux transporter periplasmic adaptor subunit [Cryomorpha ignava]|uniref:HlyD family efflux transporter periplasmic adaptor subunit n=1 Tax=Cryomorpha ignava TaxID=101383 RepID=A0A7K3WQF6_9FLAO|nr:efflux RND transporter periplasmic adaptor subunit [Cryomorpha ignava]NEN23718.1 HlyD family efflux transporter periplasmic adaptor subunit [Cryomorpha ignava]
MKSKIWIGIIGAIAAIILIYYFTSSSSAESAGILVSVKKGEFVIDITTTGELEAKNSVEILGPKGTRDYRIWNMTIQDIIDEGTLVKKGDYVATIDPSELTNKLKDSQLELEKIESKFIQTKLDTSLDMRKSRDELINLAYAVDERQLVLDQSKYEPPATIRQAEIDVEKAGRSLEQAKENYKIKRQQNIAKMQEVSLNRLKEQRNLDGMKDLIQDFTIKAPEDGMLIYIKDYNGRATKTGSQINAWNPVVATLPDLSTMISATYVNEVDIRRVEAGQMVEIGLDAFPEKRFTGKVLRVANVGEQRPNSDAKVFKVSIEVNEKDDLLRPSMTTSNRIITEKAENKLFVPLEALFNLADSITYVYKKSGLNAVKQEIEVGESNRNEVIVKMGLEEDDQVYLNKVSGMEKSDVNLLPELNGKRKQEKLEGSKPNVPDTIRKDSAGGEFKRKRKAS